MCWIYNRKFTIRTIECKNRNNDGVIPKQVTSYLRVGRVSEEQRAMPVKWQPPARPVDVFLMSAPCQTILLFVEEKTDMEPRYPEVELTWEEQQLLEKLIGLEDRGNLLRDSRLWRKSFRIVLNSGNLGIRFHRWSMGRDSFERHPSGRMRRHGKRSTMQSTTHWWVLTYCLWTSCILQPTWNMTMFGTKLVDKFSAIKRWGSSLNHPRGINIEGAFYKLRSA